MSLFLGVGVAFASLIVAFMMEGGSPLALIGPSAFLIIAGGLFGALVVSFGLGPVLKLPSYFVKALGSPAHNPTELVDIFINFAEKARKEGLLSLEEDLASEQFTKDLDPLIKRGMSMVDDGIDATAI